MCYSSIMLLRNNPEIHPHLPSMSLAFQSKPLLASREPLKQTPHCPPPHSHLGPPLSALRSTVATFENVKQSMPFTCSSNSPVSTSHCGPRGVSAPGRSDLLPQQSVSPSFVLLEPHQPSRSSDTVVSFPPTSAHLPI